VYFDPFNYPDAQYRTFVGQYSEKISAAPLPLALTVPQATELASRTATFDAAFLAAADPATRTRAKVELKRSTRKFLSDYGRMLARIIQAAPTVTDAQRIDLGLPVADSLPTPIDAPTAVPAPKVVSMDGWTASLQLRVAGSDRRGLPPQVSGAYIYSFAGPVAPTDPQLWKFEGATTRADCKVAFDNSLEAGSKVFVCACFFNPRQQTGPACGAVHLLIGGGVPETTVG
jgi:hypothetical protein